MSSSNSPTFELLIEARRLIHDADAALLGQRARPDPGLVSEIMGKHRDAALLITRFLEARGVTP